MYIYCTRQTSYTDGISLDIYYIINKGHSNGGRVYTDQEPLVTLPCWEVYTVQRYVHVLHLHNW